ncbi:uncharacterized protein A1O5_01555 [Cladophialophora psammophila CBS 110553]|uniref:Carboxylic ester hydrolase n=1 Tax=Cladophialophora psammophila CBS 110553 TaxID=1182543 RepID=W9XX87_9EURO|nr:uncharacterized protein A1O5_01555 [Cladophialophora psammophila CBS 110553]EXJ74859.1 hypothetical protein A1O5_01555 [Cladophialophora psammophila CBS 110553]
MYVSLSNLSSYLLLTAVFAIAQTSTPNNLKVTTSTGTYIGIINGTVPNVRQFLNVPYALPPVGSRRWAPPEQLTSNASAILDATSFPRFCPQYLSGAPNVYNQLLSGYLIPTGLDTAAPATMPPTTGEDCLSLSIWTPTRNVSGLPVIIFMTGGGFIIGGINIPYQLPHHWVQRTQSHIVVSINYRLGIMGFPNARGLNSQNLGILDQRMAHEWVRDNIQAFGGDPSKITIWGQSAGASSTDFHGFAYYNNSIAKGLVMESGTALLGLVSYDFAHTNFTFVASQLGCGGLNATAELDCMRQKPVETIVNFVGRRSDNATTPALSFVPIPDDKVIFSNYTERYARGLIANVPAIVGTASDEGTVLVPFTNLTAGPNQTLADEATLGYFVCPAHNSSKLRTEAGLLTYRYEFAGNFSNLSPLPWLGAYHTDDLPLFFGSYNDYGKGTEFEARTSEIMQDYLLAFMKDPHNGPKQKGWQDYTKGHVLRFGADSVAAKNVTVQTVDGACYGQGTYDSSP